MDTKAITVLLVDDEGRDSGLVGEFLSLAAAGTYCLDKVVSGSEALEAIRGDAHDLYFINCGLGERHGLHLIREAIAEGCTKPLILLVEPQETEAGQAAIRVGAADYLDKDQMRRVLRISRGQPCSREEPACGGAVARALLERSLRNAIKRKQAEAQLARSLEQARHSRDSMMSLLDQLHVGILAAGRDGVVQFANEGCERLFGRRRQALKGKHWEELLRVDDPLRTQLRALFAGPAGNGDGHRVPIHIRAIGGTHYWAELEILEDPRTEGSRILCLYDVSEVYNLRRQAEGRVQYQDLVGKSAPMKLVYDQIIQLARVDTTVLIRGETGTGKELVARALHFASHRKSCPFIPVNCAGLTDSLLSSQLFGHAKGAFTGAVSEHKGVFEAAEGGTVFLDEIADIPRSLQTNLLRVLQEKEIVRVGDSVPRKVDVRFLAATSRDLAEEVAKGSFRDDLFFRIRVARIHLPALRERREDIPLLVAWFLGQARANLGKNVIEVHSDAMRLLTACDWPGNVRELQNAIEAAVVQCRGHVLRPADLPAEVLADDAISHSYSRLQQNKRQLLEAIEKARGNRAAAARLLGIGRSTLYRRLRSFGIKTQDE